MIYRDWNWFDFDGPIVRQKHTARDKANENWQNDSKIVFKLNCEKSEIKNALVGLKFAFKLPNRVDRAPCGMKKWSLEKTPPRSTNTVTLYFNGEIISAVLFRITPYGHARVRRNRNWRQATKTYRTSSFMYI